MDLAFWLEEGTILVVLVLLFALLMGLRALASVFGNLPVLFDRLITGMMWEDTEEIVDGKKTINRRLSPRVSTAVQALAPVLAPVMINAAIAWGEKNLKLPVTRESDGKVSINLAGIDVGQLMEHLPAKYAKNPLVKFGAPIVLQMLQGKMAGGGGGALGGTPAAVASNPFLGQLK